MEILNLITLIIYNLISLLVKKLVSDYIGQYLVINNLWTPLPLVEKQKQMDNTSDWCKCGHCRETQKRNIAYSVELQNATCAKVLYWVALSSSTSASLASSCKPIQVNAHWFLNCINVSIALTGPNPYEGQTR